VTSESAVSIPGALWHITITVTGEPTSSEGLRSGLANLELAHPFGLSARYSVDTVELRYWDEGHDCRAVALNAMSLWDDHRTILGLPPWPVVGLEVLDRATFRRHWPTGSDPKSLMAPGVRQL
jgi:hypothetical protein